MYFLLNDVVLSLELQLLTPPMMARRFSALSLESVERLGREIYAEEPRLQHRMAERARRLATLIVSKAPDVNAALFVAPARGCGAEQVAARFARLDVEVLVQLYQDQQAGRLTPAIADRIVWSRPVAAQPSSASLERAGLCVRAQVALPARHARSFPRRRGRPPARLRHHLPP